MNRTEPKMDDLPELPFEQVLSYLSLEDRLKSRAVSRRWNWKINSFRVKNLCFSSRPKGFIEGKSRWVSGAFVQNFINSTRFASFFNTHGQSILSNLKHLRLCGFHLNDEDPAAFAPTLNAFAQLEELNIIRFGVCFKWKLAKLELSLPMLTSIQLEGVRGIEQLTLDSPRLQKVKLLYCSQLTLDLVHAEPVEWFMTDRSAVTTVKEMKSLKVLYADSYPIDSTLLSGLKQLREIHLNDWYDVSKLFEQKQRHARVDLKIYRCGLLLSGPDDPAINNLWKYFNEETIDCLAKNPSRLADEIPLCQYLYYTAIERVAPELQASLMKRFTDLEEIVVDKPVQDVQRFLDILKNLDNIVTLEFCCDQPQDLFDRLPEHCAVQDLKIFGNKHLDVRFLFRLNHLILLYVDCSIDAGSIRKVFENEFLSSFEFEYINKRGVRIRIGHPKRFQVLINYAWTDVPDLNAAIQFITADSLPKKMKG